MSQSFKDVVPGIWRLQVGEPEVFTPLTYRDVPIRLQGFNRLPAANQPPLDASAVLSRLTARGLTLEISATAEEDFYGGGLQLKSFKQTGLRKRLCVNSDPVADTGDSHAPVPFYLSTAGYGVYVDTLRTATFYFGSHPHRGESSESTAPPTSSGVNTDVTTLYTKTAHASRVEIDIPTARGVDIYLFAGPTMPDALRRYILFSGGGALPPIWGLGAWYRCYGAFDQTAAADLADRFRQRELPCDVYGLEPGWQSHAYSCSFTWDAKRFPDPVGFARRVSDAGFRLNLWEHAFTHPTAPFYHELLPHTCTHEVFGGIVPDFTQPEAAKIFEDHHAKLVGLGIHGFKLDECDGSDFIKSSWSFPDHAQFPGGLDGEQYHSIFGTLYARAIERVFRNAHRRTLGSVRNLGALAAPLPYVLYSDLYNHHDFLRGVATAGLSGLLWTPEVRDAKSAEDLIRRMQSVILSPQALINAWYIPMPPWEQTETAANVRGERMAGWEACEADIRDLLTLRMRLIPYIYTAFARYHFDGIPPFRPIVLEDPADPALRAVDNQFMIGPTIMAAPMLAGETTRAVVLPQGDWIDFHTDQRFTGGRTMQYVAPLERVPLFVRADTLLPLAEPVQCVRPDTIFRITPRAFGIPRSPAELFEDDGETFAVEDGNYNWVTIHPDGSLTRSGNYKGPARYV